jgi:hypothetical protein
MNKTTLLKLTLTLKRKMILILGNFQNSLWKPSFGGAISSPDIRLHFGKGWNEYGHVNLENCRGIPGIPPADF